MWIVQQGVAITKTSCYPFHHLLFHHLDCVWTTARLLKVYGHKTLYQGVVCHDVSGNY